MNSTDARSFPENYVRTFRLALSFLFGVLKRNILLIAGVVILAAAAGAAFWYAQKPYFESELVCAYNNQRYPKKTFGEMARKLNALAQSGSAGELSRILGVSRDQAASIIAIEGKNSTGSPLYEDITENYQPLYFTVRASDRRVFAALEPRLIAYLSGTPQQKLLGDLSVRNLELRIGLLEGDLRKADSVLDAYATAIRAGQPVRDTSTGRAGVADALRLKIEIEDKLAGAVFKRNLELGSSVAVMHGFAAPDHPGRGSRKGILGAALLGFLAAYCWALLNDKKTGTAHA